MGSGAWIDDDPSGPTIQKGTQRSEQESADCSGGRRGSRGRGRHTPGLRDGQALRGMTGSNLFQAAGWRPLKDHRVPQPLRHTWYPSPRLTTSGRPRAAIPPRGRLSYHGAMAMHDNDSRVVAWSGRTLGFLELIGLMVISVATLVAAGQEVAKMIAVLEVTLADLLLLFIYLEVLAMVKVYLESGSLPIRMPLYIGMVALARHLNKHIDYGRCCAPIPNEENRRSVAFPQDMAITADGRTLYVAAFGTSEVAI